MSITAAHEQAGRRAPALRDSLLHACCCQLGGQGHYTLLLLTCNVRIGFVAGDQDTRYWLIWAAAHTSAIHV